MIVERFDESLVLLQRLLGWEWHNLATLKLNAAKDHVKPLSPKHKELARSWLWASQQFYDHFHNIFQRQVDALGTEGMTSGLENLRNAQDSLQRRCVPEIRFKEQGLSSYHDVYKAGYIEHQKVQENDPDCLEYSIAQNKFTENLKLIQKERFPK